MSQPGGKQLSGDQVLLIARALSDKTRYEILKRLGAQTDALACVSVRDCMGVNPATLSHHMKELELAGLIDVTREGKFASYTLRRDTLDAFIAQLQDDLAARDGVSASPAEIGS
ncbi:putative transcriptional regulator, ArsR family [Methylocella silvestris BL2]|uniref:Putative transcriptional regulator, ArsR family n=1 Tax=Methylocella silvestris (strain DSM 15510 / CIP 108128 / LMG 27833 / NCIMB 13906 / BL2) TaxID=395965 RepID=B8EL50_METSB|nr:helix-turn-helix domain-containing protein [Methylocella silvestris]ACK49045.1 putative transcriptional regulator, ArsR family [Methylocella silvestris BL2]